MKEENQHTYTLLKELVLCADVWNKVASMAASQVDSASLQAIK